MKRNNHRPIQKGRTGRRKRKFSWFSAFSLLAVGALAYYSGKGLSPAILYSRGTPESSGGIQDIPVEVVKDMAAVSGSLPRSGTDAKSPVKTSEDQSKSPSETGPVAGAPTKKQDGKEPEKDAAASKNKPSSGSVFSEENAPSVIGQVPAGWRVEATSNIKAKFGPHKVPAGDDITFVVPVYKLVPDSGTGGVYIIEPGRTKEGYDEGGTLGSILSRLNTESQLIGDALGTLQEAFDILSPDDDRPPMAATSTAPASGIPTEAEQALPHPSASVAIGSTPEPATGDASAKKKTTKSR